MKDEGWVVGDCIGRIEQYDGERDGESALAVPGLHEAVEGTTLCTITPCVKDSRALSPLTAAWAVSLLRRRRSQLIATPRARVSVAKDDLLGAAGDAGIGLDFVGRVGLDELDERFHLRVTYHPRFPNHNGRASRTLRSPS